MFAAIVIVVLTLATLGLVGFIVLLVGMRNEPTHYELSSWAPSLLAALTRRALGVSVRKPSCANPNLNADAPCEPWFAGAGYSPRKRDDEGGCSTRTGYQAHRNPSANPRGLPR